jgi:hypothetical protein
VSHEYAYRPDPALPVVAAQRKGMAVDHERKSVEQAWHASRRWWRRQGDPILRDRKAWLAVQAMDAAQAVQWETLRKRALAG